LRLNASASPFLIPSLWPNGSADRPLNRLPQASAILTLLFF
jgi:hypothetical protein